MSLLDQTQGEDYRIGNIYLLRTLLDSTVESVFTELGHGFNKVFITLLLVDFEGEVNMLGAFYLLAPKAEELTMNGTCAIYIDI